MRMRMLPLSVFGLLGLVMSVGFIGVVQRFGSVFVPQGLLASLGVDGRGIGPFYFFLLLFLVRWDSRESEARGDVDVLFCFAMFIMYMKPLFTNTDNPHYTTE